MIINHILNSAKIDLLIHVYEPHATAATAATAATLIYHVCDMLIL